MGSKRAILVAVACAWGSVLLAGCRCEARPRDDSPTAQATETHAFEPSDYLPLEDGRTWDYDFSSGEDRWTLETRREGGDVRTLDGVALVPFEFAYGAFPGDPDPMAKTVWAAPVSGPRLLFLDGFHVRMHFEPPLAILRPGARIGDRWRWEGKAEVADAEVGAFDLHLAAEEDLRVAAGAFRALRVEQRGPAGRPSVTWWLARDVGVVKFVVAGPDGVPSASAELHRFTKPTATRAPRAAGRG